MSETPDVRVREATEDDAPGIIRVFESAYGSSYMYPQYYRERGIKRMIYSDDSLMLVAEDAMSGRILGTASVILEIGALSDLVGEFGRLVVSPEARRLGVGHALLEGRLQRVRDRLHVGVIEARTEHEFSCRIARKHGFAPVGLYPNRLDFGQGREHASVYVRYFGDALALRKNHPRVIPEAYRMAASAMANVRLEVDVIVDDHAASYPPGGEFDIEELEAGGYSSLLRIERGRVRRREVFGPLRLHYGFFKLKATSARYLIARTDGRIAGAIGFILDDHEGHVRVFELIHLDPAAVLPLLTELDRLARREWDVETIEIDVDADAPGMQRTLLQIGYRPVCYLPAFAFHRVERRDVLKMWRLLGPSSELHVDLPGSAMRIAEMALSGFRHDEILPRIREAMQRIRLFDGLDEEQAAWLGGLLKYREIRDGERLFERGDASDQMYLVVDGEIAIEGEQGTVGRVGPGECVGEVALLAGRRHSATALARRHTETGVLSREDLTRLVRRRPDVGVALYRNLAGELGDKLHRTDFPGGAQAG